MRILTLLILFFFPLIILGQTVDKTTEPEPKSPFVYSASYYGNSLWNPGFRLGVEYTLKKSLRTKVKQRKKKEVKKSKSREWLLTGDFGSYWDPQSHVAAFSTYGLQFRKTNNGGYQYQFGVSPLGYYRSFLSETYQVSEEGEVSKVFLPGRSYLAPVLTLGIGKSWPEKDIKAWFMNVHVMTLLPYNTGLVPLINLETGFRFDL